MINLVIGLIVALGGGLWYFFRKASSASALLENLNIKTKTLENDKNIAEDKGKLDSEAAYRDSINKAVEDAKAKQDDVQSLVDYFNKK